MSQFNNVNLFDYLKHSEPEVIWISVLKRGLYLFLILKLAFSWTVLQDIVNYDSFLFLSPLSYLKYTPLLLASKHLSVFLIAFLLLLLFGLISNNCIVAFLVFWFSVCLSRFSYSLLNGADLVLNIFLFLIIFIIPVSSVRSRNTQIIQVLSNSAVLIGRIQIALIYLLSGYDKLMSEAWRNGSAIFSVANLSFYSNPYFHIELSRQACIMIGWAIILFELAFGIFIAFRNCRIYLLAMGILFHLFIIVLMGLFDFGLIMIVSYSIYAPITRVIGDPSAKSIGNYQLKSGQ